MEEERLYHSSFRPDGIKPCPFDHSLLIIATGGELFQSTLTIKDGALHRNKTMKQLKCVYTCRNCFLNRFFMLRRTGRVTLFHIAAASLTRIIILWTDRSRMLELYAWPIKLTSHQSELQSNLLFWSGKSDSLSEPHTHTRAYTQWDRGIHSWESRMGSVPSVACGVSVVKHTHS